MSSGSFANLYRDTLDPLRRHLARILGNPYEAQDVAHDAYLRIRPAVETRTARNPEALLYATARRLAFNCLKRRRIAPIVADTGQASSAANHEPGVVQQVIARQELARLDQAIGALPDGCRTVFLMRKIEGLTHREISDRLGIAVSSVEKHHARALRLLRVALADNVGDVGTPAHEAPFTKACS